MSKALENKIANLEKKLIAEQEKVKLEKAKVAAEKKAAREAAKKIKADAKATATADKVKLKNTTALDKDALKFRENEEKKRILAKAKRDIAEQKKLATETLKAELAATKAIAKKRLEEEQEKHKAELKRANQLEREAATAASRRTKLEEEMNKRKQSIVDYRGKIQELNVELAKALKNQIKTKDESNTEEKKLNPSYKELKKQVDFEINQKRFFREQLKHKLKKISKESESGAARIGAKSLMGASEFISDKLNDFVNNIPVAKQLNTARKFVKENVSEAREAKFKRLSKERMTELQSGKSENTSKFKDFRDRVTRGKNADKEREKDSKTSGYFQEILSTLKSIRMGQLLNTFANMGGGFIKAIASGVGTAFESVIGKLGIKKILGGLAGALGAKKLADRLLGSTKIDVDVDGPDKNKGKPTPTGQPQNNSPKPKGNKKGIFEKMKSKVSGALSKMSGKGAAMTLAKVGARFLGPVGAALTIYEVADHFGLVDEANALFDSAMKDWFGDDSDTSQPMAMATSNGSNQPDIQKSDKPLPDSITTISNTMGTAPTQLSSNLQPIKLDPYAPTLLSTQLETANNKLRESELKSKETERINTIQAIGANNANSVNSSINSVNTVNNNSTNVISFNNSEYQTSYQKGSQVIR